MSGFLFGSSFLHCLTQTDDNGDVVHLFTSSYVSAGPCPVDVPALLWQLMWDSAWSSYMSRTPAYNLADLCVSQYFIGPKLSLPEEDQQQRLHAQLAVKDF